jgi:endonuclease YncB( thermonuclease family)
MVAVFATLGTAAHARSARVVDGDTLDVDGVTYRLHGIDVPEAGQSCAEGGGGNWPCGKKATSALEEMVLGKDVACDDRGSDGYGRTIGVCFVGDVEVNAAMVRSGHAWSFRKYAHDYDPIEDRAHSAHVGAWQAETETPWGYHERRWSFALQAVPDRQCPIKGNINRDDERINRARRRPGTSGLSSAPPDRCTGRPEPKNGANGQDHREQQQSIGSESSRSPR